MSDGAPEWPGAGLFRVHMDPLVVAGGVGKGVDALLVDGDPLGCAQALAYGLLQGGCVVECGGHVYSSNFFMSLCGSFGAGAGPRHLSQTRRESPLAGTCGVSAVARRQDRKSTRLNSSHVKISYAVFCL